MMCAFRVTVNILARSIECSRANTQSRAHIVELRIAAGCIERRGLCPALLEERAARI